MGKFLLTQMAAVAELEAGLIGERTKKALAAAKARGVKLGNPNGARALRGKQTGNAEAVVKIKEKAAQRAMGLQGILDGIKRSGITSVRAITEELNRQGVSAPRGDTWRHMAPHGGVPAIIALGRLKREEGPSCWYPTGSLLIALAAILVSLGGNRDRVHSPRCGLWLILHPA